MKTVGEVSALVGITVRTLHYYDERRCPAGGLAGLARALDRAIATAEHGDEQPEETMFSGFDLSQYDDEARERWGRTDAYTESARRVARGEMYVADPRFAVTYEKLEPGLAAYVRDVIAANAASAEEPVEKNSRRSPRPVR